MKQVICRVAWITTFLVLVAAMFLYLVRPLVPSKAYAVAATLNGKHIQAELFHPALVSGTYYLHLPEAQPSRYRWIGLEFPRQSVFQPQLIYEGPRGLRYVKAEQVGGVSLKDGKRPTRWNVSFTSTGAQFSNGPLSISLTQSGLAPDLSLMGGETTDTPIPAPLPSDLPTGLSTTGGKVMDKRIPAPLYKQWDTAWQQQTLGATAYPIGTTGCTVCSMAMALSTRGFSCNPSILNTQLTAQKAFTDSGLLIWSGVKAVTKDGFRVRVDDNPTHKVIDAQLAAGNPVLAKVLYEDLVWHWVLITGKTATDYLIHDPLSPGPAHERMTIYPRGIYAVRFLEKL